MRRVGAFSLARASPRGRAMVRNLSCSPVVRQRALRERLGAFLPADAVDCVLHIVSNGARERRTTFRVNTLAACRQHVQDELSGLGVSAEDVAWCPGALAVRPEARLALLESPAHREHRIYVQSCSSMAAALAPGEAVLDMCAAPGSKTSLLACMMQNRGRLVANDASPGRIRKLKEVLAQQGARATVLRSNGARLAEEHASAFDRVLVDAPCSGEGRVGAGAGEDGADPGLGWSGPRSRRLAGLQKQLLHAAVACVRVGGVVVYSTCTLTPLENELVVDRCLQLHAGRVVVEPLPQWLVSAPSSLPGVTSFQRKVLDPGLAQACRLLPSDTAEGFFLARLRRIG